MAGRGDLAPLLGAGRDRLQPAVVDLPAGTRRTSDLRREKVAMLAASRSTTSSGWNKSLVNTF